MNKFCENRGWWINHRNFSVQDQIVKKMFLDFQMCSRTGGNLKQGVMHHWVWGMDAPAYTHTRTRSRTHTRSHAHKHTLAHTYTHRHTRTHTDTHRYIYNIHL